MDLREMANIAGKRLLYGTAISPAARNLTRFLAIPGRLSQCLRRAVRFWLTAAPAGPPAPGLVVSGEDVKLKSWSEETRSLLYRCSRRKARSICRKAFVGLPSWVLARLRNVFPCCTERRWRQLGGGRPSLRMRTSLQGRAGARAHGLRRKP